MSVLFVCALAISMARSLASEPLFTKKMTWSKKGDMWSWDTNSFEMAEGGRSQPLIIKENSPQTSSPIVLLLFQFYSSSLSSHSALEIQKWQRDCPSCETFWTFIGLLDALQNAEMERPAELYRGWWPRGSEDWVSWPLNLNHPTRFWRFRMRQIPWSYSPRGYPSLSLQCMWMSKKQANEQKNAAHPGERKGSTEGYWILQAQDQEAGAVTLPTSLNLQVHELTCSELRLQPFRLSLSLEII